MTAASLLCAGHCHASTQWLSTLHGVGMHKSWTARKEAVQLGGLQGNLA